MADFFSNKYLLLAVRIILGSLFIYSAVTKILDIDYFVKALENYKLLPEASLNYAALFIPWLELIIGLFILAGIFVKESALLGGILMILFIAAVSIALARGLDIECGCFGTKDGSRVGILKIIENFLILLGFIWLALLGSDFLALLKSKKINSDNTGYPF
jgi:putative oxidoreductase